MLKTALLFLAVTLWAQVSGNLDRSGIHQDPDQQLVVRLLERVSPTNGTNDLWNKQCTIADVLLYDRAAASELIEANQDRITLEIPLGLGMQYIDLARVEISTDDLRVIAASGSKEISVPRSVHYRGILRGDSGSVVAISVFEQEFAAIIGGHDGDHVIGPIKNDPDGRHIYYREEDLRKRPGTLCHTEDPTHNEPQRDPVASGDRTARCVRVHWEVNYDLFTEFGSTGQMTTYLMALFNQMATLFDNDGVDVVLSEIFIWDVQDPYVGTTASVRLHQFRDERTTFNADQALLMGFGDLGGIAWLNTLCGTDIPPMAYASVHTTFENIPLYSWTVEVVTHETGHVLGSKHTHACAWNGTNTQIDGCGPAVGQPEGSCLPGPIPDPAIGGTIMSYCHLLETGIRFTNGFGPQPRAVIISRVNSASCLASCGSDCYSPYALQSTIQSAYSARIKWRNVGALTYTLLWKPVLDSTWTTVPDLVDTTYLLTGLAPGTMYGYHLISNCSTFSSSSSDTAYFVTTQPCIDPHEPNDAVSEATVVNYGITHHGRIESQTDVDYFRLNWILPGSVTINTDLNADIYQLTLLDSLGNTIATSTNSSGLAKIISVPVTEGNFLLRIASPLGQFDPAYCYSLSYSISVSCHAPPPPSVLGFTSSTAQIALPTDPTYVHISVEGKRVEQSIWTNYSNAQPPSAALNGLSPGANYAIRIRGRCTTTYQGYSPYSDTIFFTTSPDPCSNSLLVAPKVFLDGPFDPSTGLMHDSLRSAGLIPLEEPYLALGYDVQGQRTTTPDVLQITGPNAIVDWVIVELRSSITYGFEKRSALLQRDGDVVAADGISPIRFCTGPVDYFYLAIGHRNHLGCVSTYTYFNSTTTTVPLVFNFSTMQFVSGTDARRPRNGLYTLWSGDANKDRLVKYMGNENDRDAVLLRIGGPYLTNTLNGYFTEDINMDGTVKYMGPNNDRDPILQSVGGSTPLFVKSSLGP